jgi:Ser/Thr protein kinase RdoA (MazF antagonist)
MNKSNTLSVEVTHSTIDVSLLLQKLLSQYNLSNLKTSELIQRGNNDTYKLEVSTGTYILRIYRYQWRSLEEINFEIDSLLYFKKAGLNISYPIQKNNLEYVTLLEAPEGVRYALLMSYTEGKEALYKSHEDAYMYGLEVAQLHELSNNFRPKYKKDNITIDYLLYEPIRVIETYLYESKEDREYFDSFISKLLSKINKLSTQKLNYGFCHGDLHGGNAHQNVKGFEFFDFDFCGFGWRAYDIAVFRWGCKLRSREEELWSSYLSGYSSINPISEQELEWTKYFLIIRDLWVMALHIKNSKDFGTTLIGDFYIKKRLYFLKICEEDYL